MAEPNADFLVSSGIYACNTLLSVWFIIRSMKLRVCANSNFFEENWINATFISLAFLVRTLWCLVKYLDSTFDATELQERIWNRFALCLLLSSFSLVLVRWLITLNQRWENAIKRCFYLVIFVLFVLFLSLAFVPTMTDVSNILLSFLFLALSFAFVYVGRLLRSRTAGFVPSKLVQDTSKWNLWASGICTVVFAIRFVAFLYWPLSGNKGFRPKILQRWYYPWAYYVFPETVNGLTILFLLHQNSRKRAPSVSKLLNNSWEGASHSMDMNDEVDHFSFLPQVQHASVLT